LNIYGLNEHLFLLTNVYCSSSSWLVSVCMPPVSWETSGPAGFHFCAVSAFFSTHVSQRSAYLHSHLTVTFSRSLTGVHRVNVGTKLLFMNCYDF